MFTLGQYHNFNIVKELDFGIYLDGEELGEILMPLKYVPEDVHEGDVITAFLYRDSEDRLIATTEKPLAVLDDFALLRVVAVTEAGAFLYWGLVKDLFVPFREQKEKMKEGESYLVKIYLDDETNRLMASSYIEKFLNNIPVNFRQGDEVELIIAEKNDLGYKAVINGTHSGILYKNEIFQPLNPGEHVTGYIKKIREDEKIDLSLHSFGYSKIEDLEKELTLLLQQNNGFLPLNDKSHPEEIKRLCHMSKKNFKKVLGSLYKKRSISLDDEGIKLVN